MRLVIGWGWWDGRAEGEPGAVLDGYERGGYPADGEAISNPP